MGKLAADQKIPDQRATGRSTRLVDRAIQELFNRGEVTVVDHHITKRASEWLLCRVCVRLDMEHPGVEYTCRKDLLHIKLV